MGLTIVKKRGASVSFFIKAAELAREHYDNNNPNQSALIASNNTSNWIWAERSFSNSKTLKNNLIFTNIKKEDFAVITIHSKKENIIGRNSKNASPILFVKKKDGVVLSESGFSGNFFIATSDIIDPDNNSTYYSSIIQYSFNYFINHSEVNKLFTQHDFERIVNIDKDLHKDLKIVMGNSKQMYIHNEELFLDHNGILFSDTDIGDYIVDYISPKKKANSTTKFSTKSTLSWFVRLSQLTEMQNNIFFVKKDAPLQGKFFITKLQHSGMLQLYSYGAETTESMLFFQLVKNYDAYWINRLHQ